MNNIKMRKKTKRQTVKMYALRREEKACAKRKKKLKKVLTK